jgi:hypothetical protein
MSDRPHPPGAHEPTDDPQRAGQPPVDRRPGGEAALDPRGRLEDRAREQQQYVTAQMERSLPSDLRTETTEHYRESTRRGEYPDLPDDHRERIRAHVGQMAGHLDRGDTDRARWAIDRYAHTRTEELPGFAHAASEGRLEPGDLEHEDLERLGAAEPAGSAPDFDPMMRAWAAEDPRAVIDQVTEHVEQGYTAPYSSPESSARAYVGGALACGRNHDMAGVTAAVDGLRNVLSQPLQLFREHVIDGLYDRGEPRF